MKQPMKPARKLTRPMSRKPAAVPVEILEARRLLAPIFVTTTADAGVGSLRQAITTANSQPAQDTIVFSISTSDPGYLNNVWTIRPTSPLPSIVNPLRIDGLPGAAGPRIVLNGALSGATPGLAAYATVDIDDLVINGFNGPGVFLAGAPQSTIKGCFIGLDSSGTAAVPNAGAGIEVGPGLSRQPRAVRERAAETTPPEQSGSVFPIIIGGSGIGESNVISGNSGSGVSIYGVSGVEVNWNYIGTNKFGNAGVGNGADGVRIDGGAQSSVITNNFIAGNGGSGVATLGAVTDAQTIASNAIGTGATGTAIPNLQYGVRISSDSWSNTIWLNVISGNLLDGVYIDGSRNNVVTGNRIGVNGFDDAAAAVVPNGRYGVLIEHGAINNRVGDVGSQGGSPLRNVISGNIADGVTIKDVNTTSNVVRGNYIGLNAAGTSAVGNGDSGVSVFNGATGNTIDRNTISGNDDAGISIGTPSTSGNTVIGNLIGTDATGTAAVPNDYGISLLNGTTGNSIGGLTAVERNVIAGNVFSGINLSFAGTGNLITGNYVGTNITGTAALPNNAGISIVSSNGGSIGTIQAGSANVVSGNTFDGIYILNSSSWSLRGNSIGVGATGGLLGNGGVGVKLSGSSLITIDSGTISANLNGVLIADGSSSNTVRRANILENRSAGVSIATGAGLNIIGGAATSNRNVISGNGFAGVGLFNNLTTSNTIQNNYIGTDATGNAAFGNDGYGVYVNVSATFGTVTNLIRDNLISGNQSDGIRIEGGDTNVYGNKIGTNVAGMTALPNFGSGVGILNGSGNNIGSANAGDQNVISGNSNYGVEVTGPGATLNDVAYNLIGANVAGTGLGNANFGVLFGSLSHHNSLRANFIIANGVAVAGAGGVSVGGSGGHTVLNNIIGSTGAGNRGPGVRATTTTFPNFIGSEVGTGNTISNNQGAGIEVVPQGTFETQNINYIRYNNVHSNGGLGIDLAVDGVSLNDAGDVDGGPNGSLNHPIITSVMPVGTLTLVSLTLSSVPNQQFSIDVFSSLTPDGTGFGEGENYLKTTVVTTDVSGNASAIFLLPGPALPATAIVTATASADGIGTSEFSPGFGVVPPRATSVFDLEGSVRLETTFDQDVSASLGGGDLEIRNLTTNTIPDILYIYSGGSNRLRYAFEGFPGIPADGNYRLTLNGTGLNNDRGVWLDGNNDGVGGDNYTFDFFFLNGDANHDRQVGLTDFSLLAANFNPTATGKTFGQGDFNFDGRVQLTDFSILAAQFNKTLPPPADLPGSLPAAPQGARAAMPTDRAPIVPTRIGTGGVFSPRLIEEGDVVELLATA